MKSWCTKYYKRAQVHPKRTKYRVKFWNLATQYIESLSSFNTHPIPKHFKIQTHHTLHENSSSFESTQNHKPYLCIGYIQILKSKQYEIHSDFEIQTVREDHYRKFKGLRVILRVSKQCPKIIPNTWAPVVKEFPVKT